MLVLGPAGPSTAAHQEQLAEGGRAQLAQVARSGRAGEAAGLCPVAAPAKAAPAPALAADDFGDFGSPSSSSQVTHHNGRALHRRTREVAKPKARAVVSGGALLAPSLRKTKLKPAGLKPKANGGGQSDLKANGGGQ